MKKLNVQHGIKTSLADLLNKSQDIALGNHEDLVMRVFSPGFFITKGNDGALKDDFKPSAVEEGSAALLKVDINGRNPAFCYLTTGKIIGLYDTIKTSPKDIRGYTYYNPTGTNRNTNKTYEAWVVPKLVNKEMVDYLPNYQIDGQKKPLVQEYVVGLLLVQKGQTPPVFTYEEEDGPEINTAPPTRQPANTIDGLLLCEFMYNEYTDTITGLVDKRGSSRAYLKPELYDFFSESYLKHDFVLTHAKDTAAGTVLAFYKVQGAPPKLNGVLTLLGAKGKYEAHVAEVRVNCTNTSVPVNSVIGVTVTANDFLSNGPITKSLEVIPIASFTPSVDFLVIGYHLSTLIDGGMQIDPPGEDSPDFGHIDGGNTIPVNSNTSTLYFVNGLPPLPPGHNISHTGVASYILTREEAEDAFYTKSTADARYIKSGTGKQNHLGDLRHTVPESRTDDFALTAAEYQNVVNPQTKAGFGWVLKPDAGFDTVLGYITRSTDNGKGVLEFGVLKDDGTGLYGVKLADGHLRFFGQGNTNPRNDPNAFVTVAHALLNSGDNAVGDYNYAVGTMRFLKPDPQFFSNNESAEDVFDSGSSVLAFEFLYGTESNVVMNLGGNIATGLGDPRTGTDGDLDAINKRTLVAEVETAKASVLNLNGAIGSNGLLDYTLALYSPNHTTVNNGHANFVFETEPIIVSNKNCLIVVNLKANNASEPLSTPPIPTGKIDIVVLPARPGGGYEVSGWSIYSRVIGGSGTVLGLYPTFTLPVVLDYQVDGSFSYSTIVRLNNCKLRVYAWDTATPGNTANVLKLEHIYLDVIIL